jgi:type VI secretion system secreted protein VgrG
MSGNATIDGEVYTQHGRSIAIETSLGPDALLLTDVDGEEKLSHPFIYNVRLVTRRTDPEVRRILGEPVTLWLDNSSEVTRRPINGRIRRVTWVADTLRDFATYQVEVVPHLWFLDCTADCRIFQDQTVPEIIRAVLHDHGVTDFEFRLLKRDYPRLNYCVQYRESALAFISRLLEDAGIFYCHEHHADRHILVMLDANEMASHTEPHQLRLSNRGDLGEIQTFRTDAVFRPGRWALTDYDFEAPSKIMQKHVKTVLTVQGMDQREIFDFPGGYVDQSVGDWLTRMRMEAEEAQHLRVLGTSSLTTLDPGRRMQVKDGSRQTDRAPSAYLLTEVRHRARERGYFAEHAGASSHYDNDFVAIPQATQFRPPRVTPKPFVRGPQTATVVSPDKGDPIYTDMYGRIKVHFHWDRRGERSKGNTSCWVRVSQVNTGSSAGSVSIPHAGQEVVIAFLEGDPDRPMVVGRLHNAEKMPPLVLPRDKHKTEIRDHGNNKLIMHGKAGQEHLSLVTPRSLNLVAMRPVARSLSASATQEFSDIEDWKDSGGLSEVKAIFNALTQYQSHPPQSLFPTGPASPGGPPVTDPNPTGLTLAGPGQQDDNAALGIDINTMTDGKANVVTLSNNNTWCYGEYNTWVHDWANSKYRGGNYQEIGGGPDVPADNIQIVWGDNTQQTLGASEQFVEGASVNITIGASVSTIVGGGTQMTFGGNLAMIMPWSFIFNTGSQWTLSSAEEMHVSPDNTTACTGAWTVTAGGAASITAAAAVSITSAASMMQIAPVYDIVAATTFMATTDASSLSMTPAMVVITSPIIAVKGELLQLG